jgi:lysophospholipase L1-like esterase
MDYENITERRILVFGDSNTYGYDPERDGRYGENREISVPYTGFAGAGLDRD